MLYLWCGTPLGCTPGPNNTEPPAETLDCRIDGTGGLHLEVLENVGTKMLFDAIPKNKPDAPFTVFLSDPN